MSAAESSGAGPSTPVLTTASPASSSSASVTATPKDYFATDKRPIILYDGVCVLCNSFVEFMLDWDAKGEFRMAALQSDAGRALLQRCGRRPDDISSIVLVEASSAHYIRSEAVVRIAAKLSFPFPLVSLVGSPVPLLLRDPLYDLVADNRYAIMGKRDSCRVSISGYENRFVVE